MNSGKMLRSIQKVKTFLLPLSQHYEPKYAMSKTLWPGLLFVNAFFGTLKAEFVKMHSTIFF